MGCGSSVSQGSVIVVGGGYVGSAVAKTLDGKFKVTIIEPSDSFHHKMASLRASVVPGWENRIRVPYDKLLKNGTIVRQEVKEVTSGNVILADGTPMQADFIVLAHGAGQAPFPIGAKPGASSADAVAAFKKAQGQVNASSSVLIVGGGPVGIEMAGEILAQYPGKKVTLVHSRPQLLSNSTPPMYPPAVERLTESLRNIGCAVRLNARVTNLPADLDGSGFISHDTAVKYTLSDNSTVDADLVMVCTGSPKRDANLVGTVDEHNSVKVDEFLQVQGMQNVFCVGDANDVKVTKMAFTGDAQGKATCKNIERLSKGQTMQPFKMEEAEYGAMFVPLGPEKGVGAMGTTVMGDFAVKTIKSKGLFSAATWKNSNVTLPPLA
jgi:apoptosis-inducing factor 2